MYSHEVVSCLNPALALWEASILLKVRQKLQTSHFFLHKMSQLIISAKAVPLPRRLLFSPLPQEFWKFCSAAGAQRRALSKNTAPAHPAHIPSLHPAHGVQGRALLNGSSQGRTRSHPKSFTGQSSYSSRTGQKDLTG